MAASAPRFSKPPAIRQSPDDPTRLFLECQVQATPKPDVSWFQDSTPLSSSASRQKQTVQASAGNIYDIVLEISDLGASDSGTYRVVVKNSAGEVTANLSLNFGVEEDNAETTTNKWVSVSSQGWSTSERICLARRMGFRRSLFRSQLSNKNRMENVWFSNAKSLLILNRNWFGHKMTNRFRILLVFSFLAMPCRTTPM